MTRLCDQLRQIYASGDSMTVLKLLKELFDTVEDFEEQSPTKEQVDTLADKVEELEPQVDEVTEKVGLLEPKVDANTEKAGELELQLGEVSGEVDLLEPKVDANTAKHLYRHDIHIYGVSGTAGGSTLNYGVIDTTVYTANDEPINTVAKLLVFGRDYRFISNGNITGLDGSFAGHLILMTFYVNGTGTALMARYFQLSTLTAGVEINITGGITDTVTPIF